MTSVILDEYDLRQLPFRERLDKIKDILRTEQDESLRWDAVWLAGEMTENIDKGSSMWYEIAGLMAWVLKNETNGVVKHEAAFQIGLRKMTHKIPDLLYCAKNDKSDIARHEAIEALGLIRDHASRAELEEMAKETNEAVRETAVFVLKRLERLKDKGEYKGEAII